MVKICVRFQSPTAALELARFRNTVEKESVFNYTLHNSHNSLTIRGLE